MPPSQSPTANIPRSDLDPFARDVLIDPYATHAALRDAGAIVYLERYGVYAMARHANVSAALQDWQTFSSARGVGIEDFAKEKPWRPKSILLETDPPLHDRTRRVLQRVMSPAAMRSLRAAFKAKAERLVDGLVAKRTFDAVPDLAEAYPLEVFPDAVGLRPDGRENLLPFSTMVFNSFGPRNALFDEATAAAQPVLAWIFAQCERKALSPDGFGAAIWAAHDAGEITAEEAPILVRALLTAGLDTTVNGLANAIYAFTRHPDQWATLRADRTLIKPAFDEVLRWDAPVQIFFRTTTRPAILGDVTIPADAKVLLLLGAANRDPRHWPNADQFDVARRPIGHVALGAGIHACVGQLVARLEAELIFEALADRIARFDHAGPVMHKPNNTLRGLGSLPVSVIKA
jgi:4-methoxybenzoate monooxygenase (O-demethylating)